jgi:hypothetical protein
MEIAEVVKRGRAESSRCLADAVTSASRAGRRRLARRRSTRDGAARHDGGDVWLDTTVWLDETANASRPPQAQASRAANEG